MNPRTQRKRRQTHWPNGQSEQGKRTNPRHASHLNGTSPDHIDRAKRSQRLHQRESTHLERASQTSKQQELQMLPGRRGQANPQHQWHQQPRQKKLQNCTPLDHGPRQAEEQPDEVRDRGCGKSRGATCNRRGGLHRQPRVTAIAESINSFRTVPATLSGCQLLCPDCEQSEEGERSRDRRRSRDWWRDPCDREWSRRASWLLVDRECNRRDREQALRECERTRRTQ